MQPKQQAERRKQKMEMIISSLPRMKFASEFVIYLVPLIFMICDIVSGLAKAYVQKNIISHKMRSGIIKKCGEMMIILLTAVVVYSVQWPHQIIAIVSVYMILMEIISIMENLDGIGVPIPKWIEKTINNVATDIDNGSANSLSDEDMKKLIEAARIIEENSKKEE